MRKDSSGVHIEKRVSEEFEVSREPSLLEVVNRFGHGGGAPGGHRALSKNDDT
jgi:hypothetical protein